MSINFVNLHEEAFNAARRAASEVVDQGIRTTVLEWMRVRIISAAQLGPDSTEWKVLGLSMQLLVTRREHRIMSLAGTPLHTMNTVKLMPERPPKWMKDAMDNGELLYHLNCEHGRAAHLAEIVAHEYRGLPRNRWINVTVEHAVRMDEAQKAQAKRQKLETEGKVQLLAEVAEYGIWDLQDQQALVHEGWRMNHCIGNPALNPLGPDTRYLSIRSLADGKSKVSIRLRRPTVTKDDPTKNLAALHWRIQQIRGHSNSEVSQELLDLWPAMREALAAAECPVEEGVPSIATVGQNGLFVGDDQWLNIIGRNAPVSHLPLRITNAHEDFDPRILGMMAWSSIGVGNCGLPQTNSAEPVIGAEGNAGCSYRQAQDQQDLVRESWHMSHSNVQAQPRASTQAVEKSPAQVTWALDIENAVFMSTIGDLNLAQGCIISGPAVTSYLKWQWPLISKEERAAIVERLVNELGIRVEGKVG